MTSIQVIVKWLRSFTKSKWVFDDYPIRVWKNPNAGEAKVAFGAAIINWSLMVGHGVSEVKAIESLKDRFNLYRANNPRLPRPGSAVPIRYATTEKIDQYRENAADFFKRILDQDYDKGFYSDESALWPIEGPDPERGKQVKAKIIKRTLMIYGVDISETYDEPLYKIFEQIKNARPK
jgi:hypothetical protein